MISPGDLVMIVRGHDCALGEVFIVDGLDGGDGVHVLLSCPSCSWTTIVDETCAFDGDGCAPVSWLMKIEPDAEVSVEREPEEVSA